MNNQMHCQLHKSEGYFFFIVLLIIWVQPTTSILPILSNFGDVFRSGDVSVNIVRDFTQYRIEAPYSYPINQTSSNTMTLALSMVGYNQTLDETFKIFFFLYENNPTPSNKTHAVFRVDTNLNSLTSQAKVRYLACPTDNLSQNFNVIVGHISGVVWSSSNTSSYYDYFVDTLLNTSSISFTIWLSGIKASKSSSDASFWLYLDFVLIGQRQIIKMVNHNPNFVSIQEIRATLIFINPVVGTNKGYSLVYKIGTFNQPTNLNLYESWFETTNIICGLELIRFSSDFQYNILVNQDRRAIVKFGSQNWTYSSYCLVAAYKICPENHPYYQKDTKQCLSECSGQNSNDYLCCPSNCDVCSSSIVCTQCSEGYFKMSNFCYQICSEGTFFNDSILKCDACSRGCKNCTTSNECLLCYEPYKLQIDNLCYCQEGYYEDKLKNICSVCPQGCAICTSANTCTTCNSSFYLGSNKICYYNCPQGYYADNSTKTCCLTGCICNQLGQCIGSQDSLSNSTQQSSSSMGLIAAFTILGVVLLSVLIYIIYRWNKSDAEQNQEDPIDHAPSEAHIVGVQLQIQEKKQVLNSHLQEDCCICLDSKCPILTECHHIFHLNCIVSWSKKNAKSSTCLCPYCRNDLSKQKYQIHCIKCYEFCRSVTLQQLQQIQDSGRRQAEQICRNCQSSQP